MAKTPIEPLLTVVGSVTEVRVLGEGLNGFGPAGQRPALILLDDRLPDASGRDVLRELAAREATAGRRVLCPRTPTGDHRSRGYNYW